MLTERGRYGSRCKPNNNTRVATRAGIAAGSTDDMPGRQSIRHGRWNDQKELSETPYPLRRFLWSKIGSRWNDVYSEIRKNIRFDSTTQRHILQHLFDIIETKVIRENGKLKRLDYGIVDFGTYFDELYVDPDDGIIKVNKSRRKVYPKREITRIRVSDSVFYAKKDGLWKICLMSKISENTTETFIGGVKYVNSPYDYFYRCKANGISRDHLFDRDLYCSHISDAGKKDLKKIAVLVGR